MGGCLGSRPTRVAPDVEDDRRPRGPLPGARRQRSLSHPFKHADSVITVVGQGAAPSPAQATLTLSSGTPSASTRVWSGQCAGEEQPPDDEAVVGSLDSAASVEWHNLRYLRAVGSGKFGRVYVVKDVRTSRLYALKELCCRRSRHRDTQSRARTLRRMFKEELLALRAVRGHPNVSYLFQCYSSHDSFFLLLDLCEGGSLFDLIRAQGGLHEIEAMHFARQILEGVKHIHDQGFVHCDLKPENLVLLDKPESKISSSRSEPSKSLLSCVLKIIDFGLARELDNPRPSVAGTHPYCPPEFFVSGVTSFAADMWSFGVILFIMVSGYHPFDPEANRSKKQIMAHITACDWSFDDAVWQTASDDVKRLVSRLLVPNPEDRMTADEVLHSAWLQGPRESWRGRAGMRWDPPTIDSKFASPSSKSGTRLSDTPVITQLMRSDHVRRSLSHTPRVPSSRSRGRSRSGAHAHKGARPTAIPASKSYDSRPLNRVAHILQVDHAGVYSPVSPMSASEPCLVESPPESPHI